MSIKSKHKHSLNRVFFLAAADALIVLVPLPLAVFWSRRAENVYDLSWALLARWAMGGLAAVSAAVWIGAWGLASWRRRAPASPFPRLVTAALSRAAIVAGAIAAALIVAELLSPLFLPAFVELSGLHRVEDDADLLYTLKPGAVKRYKDLHEGKLISYEINSLGFRDREFPADKPPGVYRILAIGDSVTFGFDINRGDTWCTILEEKLNDWAGQTGWPLRFEVINGGVGGYNTWNEVNFLEKRGLRLQPDLVIFQFCFNDVGDPISLIAAVSYFHFKHLPVGMFPNPASAARHQETILTIEEKHITLKRALWFVLRKHSRLFGYFERVAAGVRARRESELRVSRSGASSQSAPQHARYYFQECLEALAGTDTPEFKWLRDNLMRLKIIASREGFPVVFFIPPLSYQLVETGPVYRKPIEVVADLARDMGFIVSNPLPALEAASENAQTCYIGSDVAHFNRKGHEVVAEELKKTIVTMIGASSTKPDKAVR
ncbi:MAG: hypothetical protein Kow0059_09710 [Candidatus Sumerlaeia bacterium]